MAPQRAGGGEPGSALPLEGAGDGVLAAGDSVAIEADAVRSFEVHVPAPPDGCLHLIKITLGEISMVFYGRGPTAC